MKCFIAFAIFLSLAASTVQAPPLPTKEACAIAKDAYIYGLPVVGSYRILYSYFVDRSDPEYKAGWNERVATDARVFTPDDKAMQTPNSDTRTRSSASTCAPSRWC
jgi:hypothetical protein